MLRLWYVYRKNVLCPIDWIYWPDTMDAQDVMDCVEDDYDFPVTIALDECD